MRRVLRLFRLVVITKWHNCQWRWGVLLAKTEKLARRVDDLESSQVRSIEYEHKYAVIQNRKPVEERSLTVVVGSA